MTKRIHKAVNWNKKTDDFTLMFWNQNIAQMWTDTEFSPAKDETDWARLSPQQQDVYKKVLAGLTLLDTKQSEVGMPCIKRHIEDSQRKGVLSFMEFMEAMHAKSYSTIFTTLLPDHEITDILEEFVESNQYLQYKAEHISHYYENITSKKSLYLAMVASVFLESFLFYSGFFYPLYLAGQGRMVASGEIINLILRDESIHGVYISMLAQELYQELTPQEQEEVDYETKALLDELMENELKYTEEIYAPVNLDHDVKNFLYYNANKAMMNLGKEPQYEERRINPIVMNGLSTESKNHDFFSVKGNSYVKAIHKDLTDADFVFNI
ncbi:MULTISPECIES: class 1b ribonucleoside-diphosphate reductase subunit beta [Bacillus]|uniref:class 1b ribonucleoside-diphosphate reductase subunit beta n=1 Tax=Bacillus TaxID=1386 RepID=UPI000BF30EA2|nr:MULTISPECIES: class 1b ribonucleoside-diphosphate reductase subunit beta [Bacillus]MCP1324302.1 class 1b ribonucleoside-diphosphate reductase subunit beta [Bacillus sp. S0628]PGA25377.1 class 1b ribonucleoside-diphosphate reductase subunit beta [Bacillus thuringiensis]PGU82109.1 class 1b ribonucleoside-diphosphate reductase subunit beta [Bacillus cereus]